MPDSDHRSPLSLEDLLRLKRAERPSPEFWSRFEGELRQKQLAALIDRRPWWQNLPQMLVQRRTMLPLGATAILAFSLVSIKSHAPKSVDQVAAISSESTAAPASIAPAPASPVLKQSQVIVSDGSVAQTDLTVRPVQVADVSLSANLPDHTSELTPWSAPRPAQSSTAQLFATNNEASDRVEPRLVRTFVSNSVTSALNRVQRSGGADAELASASALASKRSRLLAQFNDRQFTPEPQAPALVRERLTRQLLADAGTINDHLTRVGLKGDQVSLKF